MRRVDRETLQSVVKDFLTELDEVGLSFPGGIEGALTIMDGHISASAASRLRRLNGSSSTVDPWERLTAVSVDLLAEALQDESVEVAAVALSKLPVQKAAEWLRTHAGDTRADLALHALEAAELTGADASTAWRSLASEEPEGTMLGQLLAARGL